MEWRERADAAQGIPDAAEIVQQIHRQRADAGEVATSVNALGLAHEPDIVDASHVEHAKPEPDLLLRAAEELEVHPERAWYVGDSTWDMAAAVAAAMIPIAVTAGSAATNDALRGAGAAVVVERLDEIADALRAP